MSTNGKFVEFFNEMLATELATEQRMNSRIKETPIEKAKEQMKYHLEQTRMQQERLRDMISKIGGNPTNQAAELPILDRDGQMNPAQKELLRTRQDAIIETAEIVSYKMLMEMAEKAGMKDAIPALKQSLQEEVAMANFISGNAPMVLSLMWPKLQE